MELNAKSEEDCCEEYKKQSYLNMPLVHSIESHYTWPESTWP
jgi:hypothetical protein